MTNAYRSIMYRILPDAEQKELCIKTFGCCRFVYNRIFDEQKRRYGNGDTHMSRNAANNYCNQRLKGEFPWLREVDKFALTNAVYHMDAAYRRFFTKIGGFPKYKSRRRSKASYTTNFTNGNIAVGNGFVKLPKLGRVKAKIHRLPKQDWTIRSATVSMDRCGDFFVSVLFSYEEDVAFVKAEKATGLDYKSDGFYVDAEGTVCGSPKYYRKAQRKLAKEQRRLSRKTGSRKGEKKSNNWIRQKQKVDRIYRKIANQRRDFVHKESYRIANGYDLVGVEDLDMRAMSNKGFGNGKATSDNGWGMFLTFLEYKMRARGKHLIKVDKWFPSSQICSACGTQNPQVRDLSVRTWICPDCGTVHDRDVNAAINIRNEALRINQSV